MKKNFILLCCLCIGLGCKKRNIFPDNASVPIKNVDSLRLFSILSPKETGISFVNQIKESMYMNGLTYEYIYNGAGVSVGDVNNDGLPDIFFVSNFNKNELFINQGGLKFIKAPEKSRISGSYGFRTGTTMADINHDGRLDIYVCKSGLFEDPNKRRNELYINTGNDKDGIPLFKEAALEYGLDLPHQSTQAAFLDYDKDGDLDMFLLNHGTNTSYTSNLSDIPSLQKKDSPLQSDRLFRNDNGKFTDVSDESGIINNAISFGLGVAIGDFNNDGWPDILVGQDYAEKDHMYINQQNGTFKEVIQKATNHISNFSMGNDIADFNNDGLLDFISVDMVSDNNYDTKTSMSGMAPERFYQLTEYGLHHQYMFNALQLNNGMNGENNTPLFSDVAQLAGVSNTDWSWAPLFFDMDNDGLKDLFVSNGIKRDFRNNDYVKYKEKRLQKYLKDQQTSKDPKKLLETYIKDLMSRIPKRNKDNLFFRNNGDLTFAKQNGNWQINAMTSSTGAAYADLDNDGDLDIVTNNVDDFSFIYRNNTNELQVGNNFVQFKLKGAKENPLGLGSRLTLEYDGIKQVVEHYLTRGFQSSSGKKVHFGIGQANKIDTLTVQWPDGKLQKLYDLNPNQSYELSYSEAERLPSTKEDVATIFKDITEKAEIDFVHNENLFDDFKRESLLPHRMSQFGPALAIGDVNNDGLDDMYIGGALGFSGCVYLQNTDGTFVKDKINLALWELEKKYEDVSALFFDADLDGNIDLYVVSGGNELSPSSSGYQDRLYRNMGDGNFQLSNSLPKMNISGSIVKSADFDADGDTDIFIGGRQLPGKYPYPTDSKILRNDSRQGKISFSDITESTAPDLIGLGMVTDMEWIDVDNDSDLDAIIVGEWMGLTYLKNDNGTYRKQDTTGLEANVGWWNSIEAADFDNDGDVDFIAGNLGLNYKYKATTEAPFEIYTTDFDKNGSQDIVLGYYDNGNLFPLRGRECSSNQMPFIKEKFSTYDLFAKASLVDVYGKENMDNALSYRATNFATCLIENLGDGTFKVIPLNQEAQFSSVNTIQVDDYNKDDHLDVLIAGNLYGSEVETPRNDAGHGLLLLGNGKNVFAPVPMDKSGVCVKGDVRISGKITFGKEKKGYVFVKNQERPQVLTY